MDSTVRDAPAIKEYEDVDISSHEIGKKKHQRFACSNCIAVNFSGFEERRVILVT